MPAKRSLRRPTTAWTFSQPTLDAIFSQNPYPSSTALQDLFIYTPGMACMVLSNVNVPSHCYHGPFRLSFLGIVRQENRVSHLSGILNRVQRHQCSEAYCLRTATGRAPSCQTCFFEVWGGKSRITHHIIQCIRTFRNESWHSTRDRHLYRTYFFIRVQRIPEFIFLFSIFQVLSIVMSSPFMSGAISSPPPRKSLVPTSKAKEVANFATLSSIAREYRLGHEALSDLAYKGKNLIRKVKLIILRAERQDGESC